MAVLIGLLHSAFPFAFQFEMFVRLVRPPAERVWTDVLCAQYRMNKPRPYAPKKKGAGGGNVSGGGTSPEVTPLTTPQTSPRSETALETPRPGTPGAQSAESLLAYILPLNLAENIGDEFWTELFPPQTD